MNKVELTPEQAEELYYQINSYYLFLQCAENIDKTIFGRLKFWDASMNNHLRKARESVAALKDRFNQHFRAKNEDQVNYDTPAELYKAMDILSRLDTVAIESVIDRVTEALNQIEADPIEVSLSANIAVYDRAPERHEVDLKENFV